MGTWPGIQETGISGPNKQEIIPVGCLSPAFHRTGGGGVSLTETPLDREPQTKTSWIETPGQRPPGQRPPGQRPPRRNMGPGTEIPLPRRNMETGSQTGSDTIQRPPCEQND